MSSPVTCSIYCSSEFSIRFLLLIILGSELAEETCENIHPERLSHALVAAVAIYSPEQETSQAEEETQNSHLIAYNG